MLATQCLQQSKPKTFEIHVSGSLGPGVTAKDVILAIIGKIGTAGATGTVVEYTGPVIRALSMEQRMTICNMSIEAGARAGMVAPDEKTFAYLEGRRFAPKGRAFERSIADWESLVTDAGAVYDRRIELDANTLAPQVTWGTNPGMVVGVDGRVPDPNDFDNEVDRRAAERALEYMGLEPGTYITDLKLDRVFIGSCTNSRIEDLGPPPKSYAGKKLPRPCGRWSFPVRSK